MFRAEKNPQATPEIPTDLEMYNVPGQDPITPATFRRYLRRKEQYDALIREAVPRSAFAYEIRIKRSYRDERAQLIGDALRANNPQVEQIAAQNISAVLPELRAELVELGLASTDLETQKCTARTIPFLRSEEIDHLRPIISTIIRNHLASDDIEQHRAAGEMIEYASVEDQPAFQLQLTEIIRQNFQSTDRKILDVTAILLDAVPATTRAELIAEALESKNIFVQSIAAYIKWEPDSLNVDVFLQNIRRGLESPDPETQIAAIAMIRSAPYDERESLIDIALSSTNIRIQKSAAETAFRAFAPREGFRQRITQIIQHGLTSPDIRTRITAAEMIQWAMPEDQRSIFKAAKAQGLGDLFIQPPLYQQQDISETTFSRNPFTKTGSELTVMGGPLRTKTITRRIDPQAFLAWQTAFEQHEHWKKHGFNYIPIEPIQSFRLTKQDQVDVHCTPLDLNYESWIKLSSDFVAELQKDRERIIEGLLDLNIEHGHTHLENFVLRFFRKPDGTVDFSKKPRIYLIDFDMARFV